MVKGVEDLKFKVRLRACYIKNELPVNDKLVDVVGQVLEDPMRCFELGEDLLERERRVLRHDDPFDVWVEEVLPLVRARIGRLTGLIPWRTCMKKVCVQRLFFGR